MVVEVKVEALHVMRLLQEVQVKALLKVAEAFSLLSPLTRPQTTTPFAPGSPYRRAPWGFTLSGNSARAFQRYA